MAIKIDGAKEIFAKLEKEGEAHVVDSPEYWQDIKEINRRMEEFRRESRMKRQNSWIAASKFFITS